MPRRDDLRSVLVIGSGPIVIGQACEFDYSGTQACRVLQAEGLRVVLVNSNPATIMTDPEFADATYVEPITPEIVEQIIEQERPDALLATLGGQTALNTAMALHERRRPRPLRRRADRRRRRRDPAAARTASSSSRSWPRSGPSRPLDDLPHHGGLPVGGRGARLPGGGAAVVHDGWGRLRDRLRRGRAAPHRRRRAAGEPDHRGAARGVDPRVEGVRAGADARPQRQRRGRLLDREPRPDGRAHRRLDHGGPGDDPHRSRVPAPARHRDRRHPGGRRRHRRLQHPVRGRTRRPDASSSSR